ncbi:MAG TPA: SRPBCC family protein [Candidatus Binataceae bacterium]|nr:SRPBCC family protein [Candidatus Binataceae bacterium]
MSKTYKIIGALVVIVVLGYAGWHFYQSRRATKAGILSENIVHDGNTWTADFTAMIPAPEDSVYDAVRDVEKTHSAQIRSVKVISQTDNSKTVEIEMDGPGGQPVTAQMVFQYDPANRRISYQMVGNPAFDLQAEYKFDVEGASTLITYHQTTRMAQSLPVPDEIVKQVIRSVFISQLEGLKQSLNIASTDQPEDSGEEP